MKPFYPYKHIVTFEETNFLGNVYYIHYLTWQGKCRELFLREHAPDVVKELNNGFLLVTLQCSCDYLNELFAFDEVDVRMHLEGTKQNRISLRFDYWRMMEQKEELVAVGRQELGCMRRDQIGVVPTTIPKTLKDVLNSYL